LSARQSREAMVRRRQQALAAIAVSALLLVCALAWFRPVLPNAAVFTTTAKPMPAAVVNLGLPVYNVDCDTTFDNKPLFGSMLHETERIARGTGLEYAVWMNADIDAQRLARTIQRLASYTFPWLAVATRWDGDGMHRQGGVDVFIWNNVSLPLIRTPYPPFVRSANIWDNWLVQEAAVFRTVIDVSRVLHARHADHGGKSWALTAHSDWLNYHNRYVCLLHQRGYSYGFGTHGHLELAANGQIAPLGHDTFELQYRSDRMAAFRPQWNAKGVRAGHQLTALLARLAKGKNRVILTGCTQGFLEHVLNFACNLRRLGLDGGLIVAAFDRVAYEALYAYGLAVFLTASHVPSNGQAHTYGTDAYKVITKLKTAATLEVLDHAAANLHLLWLDPDVSVFNGNLGWTEMLQDFHVQNNNPTSLPQTDPKLNSGVYFLRNQPWVRAALSAILDDAAASAASEQMSWNAVLCATTINPLGPCEVNGNPVFLLNRDEYATGHPNDTATAAVASRTFAGVLWHNNWVKYREKADRAARFNLSAWSPDGYCNHRHNYKPWPYTVASS
jgi:hypothetical protein